MGAQSRAATCPLNRRELHHFRTFWGAKNGTCMRTSAPDTMPALGGLTSAPMSTSRFFRYKPRLLSHPRDPLPLLLHRSPDQSSLCMCAAPLQLSLSHPKTLHPVLFTSPTCPAEHTTIPFIACLSAPFSGGERGGGGGYKNKKAKETIKWPLLPMNPMLAVSQLEIL